MQNSLIDHFSSIIGEKSRIVITSHTNPDGDAIGSSLAFMWLLRNFGHDVAVVIPNMYPGFLSWMPGIEDIIIYEKSSKTARKCLNEAAFIFCLDYNTIKRSGVLGDILPATAAKKILIDHHPEPELDDFDFALSIVDISSTSELIFHLLKETGLTQYIDEQIAACLYVGIMTDTGSFSHAIKFPETFRATASLIEAGIDAERIHRLVYDTFSENRLKLLGYAISQCMIVFEEYRTAIIYLSKKDLKAFDFQIGDTEGIVNFPLSMAKINMAVLITEKKDQVRLSFRSKGNFSVNDFARRHFEGGGHYNAAGGNSCLSLSETIEKLRELLPGIKEEIDYLYE
ncbi:MAG: bifunctional oligoribonuclease/PAP phosphatase NrnA [Bacteroidetes bacterium]|nr:bifunctional oligoribonuclease/PAP phosphatase NrnA [Bacteroidales bacterium]MBU1010965.1 bifunctional oligoribonuclease/PAP phosphatase NrnA [Bacteroidota bacterium]